MASAITTISATTQADLIDHLPKAAHKTTVIGCPVGTSFQPAPAGAINSEEFRVIQIGAGPNKNLELVAAALEGLPVHLHVVGRMTDDQRNLMDHLQLPYSQDSDLTDAEIRSAYQQSSLLVFASTYEGFGMPILEAQACGIPVVTSDISPMRDVAGGAGILVDPHDVDSIRRGVEAVLVDANLRSTLGHAGQQNAAQYTPTKIAGEYADIYRRLLNRRRV